MGNSCQPIIGLGLNRFQIISYSKREPWKEDSTFLPYLGLHFLLFLLTSIDSSQQVEALSLFQSIMQYDPSRRLTASHVQIEVSS